MHAEIIALKSITQMKKSTIFTFGIYILYTFAWYLWIVLGIEGGRNLFLFTSWFMIVIGALAAVSYFAMPEKEASELYTPADKVSPARRMFGRLFSTFIVVTLVWFGHWITGVFYIIMWIVTFSIALEERKKHAAALEGN